MEHKNKNKWVYNKQALIDIQSGERLECVLVLSQMFQTMFDGREIHYFFLNLPPVNDIIDLTCKVILQVNLSHVNTVALHCCVLLIWIQVAGGAVCAERSTDFPHPGNIWGDNSS